MIKKKRLTRLVGISLLTALNCILAQIMIPFPVPVTMQTFAVLLSLMLLPKLDGVICTALYVFMGAVGLPVFSGFTGGIGHVLGLGGGYLVGFPIMGLIYVFFRSLFGDGRKRQLIYGAVSLLSMYIIAVLWIAFIYTGADVGSISAIILAYALPFVLPDAVKLFLAYILTNKLKEIFKFGKEENRQDQ